MSGAGLRVLQVCQPPDGGAAEHVRLLTSYLVSQGHRVTVAGPEVSLLRQMAASNGARYHVVPGLVREISPRNDARALVDLVELFKAEPWDVVHLHSSKAGILGRAAALAAGWRPGRWAEAPPCRGFKAVVLYTPHCFAFLSQMAPRRRRLFLAIEKVAKNWGDGVVAVSRWEYTEALARGAIDPRRSWIILNGADPRRDFADFVPPRQGRTGSELVIGTVTRLQPEKGGEEFIRMAALVVPHIPEVSFEIVGDGWERPALERLATELGVGGQVHFRGFQEDVSSWYARFHLFVLSSRQESMPLALMEAMAWGLPCVATAVGGIPELVRDGVTGVLVPPGDYAALADAVVSLRGDPSRMARLGQEALSLYQTRCTPRVCAEETEKVYRLLTSGSAATWSSGGDSPSLMESL